jgi:hypothetical protein
MLPLLLRLPLLLPLCLPLLLLHACLSPSYARTPLDASPVNAAAVAVPLPMLLSPGPCHACPPSLWHLITEPAGKCCWGSSQGPPTNHLY